MILENADDHGTYSNCLADSNCITVAEIGMSGDKDKERY
jgi:hypothetical protein